MTRLGFVLCLLALLACSAPAQGQLPTAITVSSQNPALIGAPVKLTATVSTSDGLVTRGSVIFIYNGWPCTSQGVALDSNGQASCNVNFTVSGPNNVQLVYQPNDGTFAGSNTIYVQVMEWFQTLSLTSSGSPSTAGSAVTFSTDFGNVMDCPTDPLVDFFDNGVYLGSAPILPPYEAQFSTPVLSVGQHSITASWNGYPFCQNVTSAPLVQDVQDGATVSLSLSANQVQFLNPVLLTSTVSSAGGTPSGSVNFYDGLKLLNSAPVALNSGIGRLPINLAIGKHTIVAQYPGTGTVSSGLSSSIVVYRSPKPH
jgi:hypothetical protein